MIRFLKLPLVLAVTVVLLADLVVALRLWGSGWPKEISLSSPQSGVGQVHVIAIPFTTNDWLVLSLAIAIHVALGVMAWKACRSPF